MQRAPQKTDPQKTRPKDMGMMSAWVTLPPPHKTLPILTPQADEK